jgi:hypothetical protein
VGKEWVRTARINFKPEWRACDGAEIKDLIKFREAALLPDLVLAAADVAGAHAVITQAMVSTRERDNALIVEDNMSKVAQRDAALSEHRNECWLAIEVSMHTSAPIRLESLRVTHPMAAPLPLTWVDGIAAFRAIETLLVTNAVACSWRSSRSR